MPARARPTAPLASAGRLDEAQPLLDGAARALEAAHGGDDLRTANALHALALLHWARGDLAAAHKLLLRAARPRVRTLGMAHPDAAATLHALAEVARAQGDEPRALAIQRDLLQALHEAGLTSPAKPAVGPAAWRAARSDAHAPGAESAAPVRAASAAPSASGRARAAPAREVE